MPEILYLDLNDEEKIEEVVDSALKLHGHIDIVINNAGISYRGKIEDTDIEVQKNLMKVNYFGAVIITKGILFEVFLFLMPSTQLGMSISYATLFHNTMSHNKPLRVRIVKDEYLNTVGGYPPHNYWTMIHKGINFNHAHDSPMHPIFWYFGIILFDDHVFCHYILYPYFKAKHFICHCFISALMPSMIERKQGHIVAVSSVQGKISVPYRSACKCNNLLCLCLFTAARIVCSCGLFANAYSLLL